MPPHPQNNPTYTLQSLTYHNRIVLDYTGHPILAFHHLPLTISSAVEGFRLEAWMRQDDRLSYHDIVARMRTELLDDGSRVPIFKSRALASRCNSFRDHAGCVAWRVRDCDTQSQSRAYMDGLRSVRERASNLIVGEDLSRVQRREFYAISRAPRSQVAASGARAAVSGLRVDGGDHHAAGIRESSEVSTVSAGQNGSARRSGQLGTRRYYQDDDIDTEWDEDANAMSTAGGNDLTVGVPESSGISMTSAGQSGPARRSGRLGTRRYYQDVDVDIEGDENANSMSEENENEALADNGSINENEDAALSDTNTADTTTEEPQFPPFSPLEEPYHEPPSPSPSPSPSSSTTSSTSSTPSLTSSPENPHDARNLIPHSLTEITHLQQALAATKQDFRRLTGQDPNWVDPMENYFSQWAALQSQLRIVLEKQGRVGMEEGTVLYGLEGWEGGIGEWRDARRESGEWGLGG